MSENRAISIVKASAGSGKTFRLTLHYITLLLSGHNKHRKILAVTFTNKATAEMKERILSVLAGLATHSEEPFILSYQTRLLATFPDLSAREIQFRAREAYINILHDYSNFSINTIDKFVQKVVRSFGYELGFDPGYRIETNSYKVIADLSRMLHKSLDDRPELIRWIVQLAKAQIRANKSWNYERTLSSIALHIFSERYWDFEQALSLPENASIFEDAFIRAQERVSEFEARVIKHIKQIQRALNESELEPEEVAGKSRHIVFNLQNFNTSGLSRIILDLEKYGVYADDESKWVPKKSSKESAIMALFQRVRPILNSLLGYYKEGHRSYFLSLLLLEEIHYLRLMEEMNRLLAKYRRDNRLLLIGDASRLLSGITREQAQDLSFVWEKTGVRYNHFLIDEFQDTSEKQWANFLPLIKNAVAEWEGPLTHHLLVGDVKQSIYRWRNGDWRILHRQAEHDIGRNYIQYENLGENFRSSPPIVAFNNTIFEQGSKWLQERVNELVLKEGGMEFYHSFWVQKTGYDRVIEQAYSEVRQDIPEANKGMFGAIEVQYLEVKSNAHRPRQTQEEALQQTADRLYRWIEEEKRYKPSQIGILVRKNARAMQLIEFLYQDLRKRGNPNAFQVISGDALKLKNNDVIKLFIESLRLIIAAPDKDGIFRAVCLQLYHQIHDGVVPPVNSKQWINLCKDPDLLPNEIVDERELLSQLPLSELVERFIDIYGLNEKKGIAIEEHLPYLFAFHDIISQYTEIGDGTIESFLTWWEEEDDNFSLPVQETGQAVQVMTIHKSKGLAFDAVMLPFLDWEIGRFDAGSRVWARLDGTPYEAFRHLPMNFGSKAKVLKSAIVSEYFEERMLRAMDTINEIYVACTRARKHLYINLIQDKGQLNTFLAGDIVRFALKGHDSDLLYNKGLDSFDPSDSVETEDSASSWSFTSYPAGNFLKKALKNRTGENRAKNLEPLARKGNLAHLLLSRVDDRDTLDVEISKMRAEGLILKEEEAELRVMVAAVLEHPGFQALQDGAVRTHKERSILDFDGNLYRPDKVIIKGEHAIVLDFKFTGREAINHRQQVLKYKNLLMSMGFDSVKAFIFYGSLNKLTEIETTKLI